MSVTTTQPGPPTPALPTSGAPVPIWDTPAAPREQAGAEGVLTVDRRRNGGPDDTPMAILMRLPAVVVLERVPVPSLAMARDGSILFANPAFAAMVGHQQDRLVGAAFSQIFNTAPAAVTAVSGVDALANMIVELQHAEGWTVRARMSKSAMMRRDDPLVLVIFEDVTEQLWQDER